MVELVDTYALGAYAARCAGSNPVPGTKLRSEIARAIFLCYNRKQYGKNHEVSEPVDCRKCF